MGFLEILAVAGGISLIPVGIVELVMRRNL